MGKNFGFKIMILEYNFDTKSQTINRIYNLFLKYAAVGLEVNVAGLILLFV